MDNVQMELVADGGDIGQDMYRLMAELYPICRSITGNGVRQSLSIIQKNIPLEVHEVPTGTQVFDWTVPREWNIRDAYVKNPAGEKIVDFKQSNLHVLNYSVPIHQNMSLGQLKEHLFSIPEQTDLIPYRTSYYQENWGFCVTHRLLERLDEGQYEVCIDSSLEAGSLTYGELVLPGRTEEEVLISCHICHPSLANDNLSGVVLAATLAKLLDGLDLRYTYRFLFIPGTIGSITWLALHEAHAHRIKHGLVIAGVGDSGIFHYKKSRRGDAEIDRVVEYVLSKNEEKFETREFTPYGYDERQYCSPGFNLPVGCLTRTPYGEYPQYHTSADNLDFVLPENLAKSLEIYSKVIFVLEHNRRYVSNNPNCEPQLGKRGLYGTMGGKTGIKDQEMAYLWVLNFSDGTNDLLNISQRSGFSFDVIKTAADRLFEVGLITDMKPING